MNDATTPQHGNHMGGSPDHLHADPHHTAMHPATGHGAQGMLHSQSHHGRDKIHWSPEVWRRIDAAVREEITRSRIGAKFLPTVHVHAKTTTVPSDTVVNPNQATAAPAGGGGVPPPAAPTAVNVGPPGVLYVDETSTTRVNEVWVEFSLTPAQVEEEAHVVHGMHHQPHASHAQPEHTHHQGHQQHNHHHQAHASTGITLATRAANILAQVEDMILFQGQNAFQSALIDGPNTTVGSRFETADLGLLNLLLPGANLPPGFPTLNPDQVVTVSPVPNSGGRYQGNTVAAVALAFSTLQSYGQYGPYALVLQTTPFADANSPLPTTLITPAEPIRHLMNAGFFGTGSLPPFAPSDPTKAGAGGLNGGFPNIKISAVSVTDGGAGYSANTTVSIDGGGLAGGDPGSPQNPGVQAQASTTVVGGAINSVLITTTGSGYWSAPTVNFAPPPGGAAQRKATVVVPSVLYSGFVVSLGGNTMDLVRGKMTGDEDVIVRFEQIDADGYYRFRVVERFALRLKDITAVVQLQFMSA